MLGMVVTEFCEMVETAFSPELLDRILMRAGLASGGAYTAVGQYPHEEMQRLVAELARETETPAPALLEAFGEYLFPRLVEQHPRAIEHCDSLLSLLDRLDATIHPAVRRLYPAAELPSFTTLVREKDRITLAYRSSRRLESLAVGLIRGAARHFGRAVEVTLEAPEGAAEVRTHVRLVR